MACCCCICLQEERLKHRVLGTRERGLKASGKFNHATGVGHVPYHSGDYEDAIKNRKARVWLLSHETLGGMSPATSRLFRRLGREAARSGTDGTDYTKSYTARSYVPYYAQKISGAIVMNGAQGILVFLDGVSRARSAQLRRALNARA